MASDKGVTLGPQETEAVRGILHYLWESEQSDYVRQDDDGRREHVYVDMIKLRDALNLGGELLGNLNV